MDVQTPGAQQGSELGSRRGCGGDLIAPRRVFRSAVHSARAALACLSAAAVIAGCSDPAPEAAPEPTQAPVQAADAAPPPTCDCPAATPDPAARPSSLTPVSFSDLPDWAAADLRPAAEAFGKSCASWAQLPPDRPISLAALYGGSVRDWTPACAAVAAAMDAPPAELRAVLESTFRPYAVSSDPASKLTGYFEPVIEARRAPEGVFDAPIPSRPADLISVDLGVFEPSLAGRRVWGRVEAGELRLYPDRAAIRSGPEAALAWARDSDVFYLQIQGSGRLVYPDGAVERAAFAAHNHRPFRSLARHLLDEGMIPPARAGMDDIKSWIEQSPGAEAAAAMNINPRYVWFGREAVTDPSTGPKGAQGIPLTPLGSLAVDPAHHPYGAPLFIRARMPDRIGSGQAETSLLVVAQDAGGAIKGPVRGDLFWGWGEDAGARAARTNGPLAMWVLLPAGLSPPQTTGQ
ncbi:murein transglycosylase [bacterium]|nr:murein transglycosylase [bacterium]